MEASLFSWPLQTFALEGKNKSVALCKRLHKYIKVSVACQTILRLRPFDTTQPLFA